MIEMQKDYYNNRYYNDNKSNFLELYKLKQQSPNNCAKILNRKLGRGKYKKQKYAKYHPILLWINDVIQKFALVQNLNLNEKVYFILNDLVAFNQIDKKQRTYNIFELYPNYDGIDNEQVVLKQLIMDYPNKWSQLLLERSELKTIYEYILRKTPKLTDEKYDLVTKCYWIFNNIIDFPKCKVDGKTIFKNVRSFIQPCYDTCCKKCGQIFAGWKRVKRNDYDYNQIKNARKQPKYLLSIFETKDSEYKKQYFKIIENYKNNPISFVKIQDCLNNPELYSEKHHINPRWYYITNKIEIDNSDLNLIRVRYEDHVKLHFLLVKHYECIKDKRNYYKALYACKAFCKKLNTTEKIYELPEDILTQLKIYKIQADSVFAKLHSGKNCHLFKWDKQTLKNMLHDYVAENYNLKILKEKYNYNSDEYNFRALLKRNKMSYPMHFKIGCKNNKCFPTKNQYLEYKNIYEQFGFEYFKTKYNYPCQERALVQLFKKCIKLYKI